MSNCHITKSQPLEIAGGLGNLTPNMAPPRGFNFGDCNISWFQAFYFANKLTLIHVLISVNKVYQSFLRLLGEII